MDQQAVVEANRVYFRVLGDTRASLSRLGSVAFLTVVLLGMDTFVGLNALVFWEGAVEYLGLFVAHVVILGLCALFVPLSLAKVLLYRFQAFFSGAMAVLATVLAYSVCLMGVVLSSFDGVQGEGISPTLFGVVGVVAIAAVTGATALHVSLLRQRLRVGHSERRTMANFEAVSGAPRSKTFGLPSPW